MKSNIPTVGLLFDMDGTLVDSTPLVEKIWTEFAQRHGIEARLVMEFAHGRPTRETVANFVREPARITSEVAAIAAAEASETDGITSIPGALDYIESLDSGGWAIVTSATRHITMVRMAAAGLPLPAVVVTAENVTQGKPSPEGYLQAARALNVQIANCVVFEDSGPGVVAGVSSGAEVVVVGNYVSEETAGLARIKDFSEIGHPERAVGTGPLAVER